MFPHCWTNQMHLALSTEKHRGFEQDNTQVHLELDDRKIKNPLGTLRSPIPHRAEAPAGHLKHLRTLNKEKRSYSEINLPRPEDVNVHVRQMVTAH